LSIGSFHTGIAIVEGIDAVSVVGNFIGLKANGGTKSANTSYGIEALGTIS